MKRINAWTVMTGVLILTVLSTFASIALFPSAHAANLWYVTPMGDDSGDCMTPLTACATINGAIAKSVAGDIINVSIGDYTGSGDQVVLIDKNIVLSGGWDTAFIDQSGASTVDGESSRRGITVSVGGVTATAIRFVVRNGVSISGPGGGGIQNNGILTLNNCTIQDNASAGIRNLNYLIANDSTISGNSNDSGGGGIWNMGAVTLNNSTVSGNMTTSEGGGISNFGAFVSLAVNNSTISANVAAFRGGGLANGVGSTTTLSSTIVAGNTGPLGPDCVQDAGAPISSLGNNLIGNTLLCNYVADPSDLTDIDARLGPLQDNGGPTFTHALLADSPAMDAGSNNCPPPATDQRGVIRPQGSVCDVGAYELEIGFGKHQNAALTRRPR